MEAGSLGHPSQHRWSGVRHRRLLRLLLLATNSEGHLREYELGVLDLGTLCARESIIMGIFAICSKGLCEDEIGLIYILRSFSSLPF